MNQTAYLILFINTKTRVVDAAEIHSEYPVSQLGFGHYQALAADFHAADYQTAQRMARDAVRKHASYEWLRPILDRRRNAQGGF